MTAKHPEGREMRCGSCIAIGCECPQGYFAGTMLCDVCRFRFVLCKPCCAPAIHCPECGGTVDQPEQAT